MSTVKLFYGARGARVVEVDVLASQPADADSFETVDGRRLPVKQLFATRDAAIEFATRNERNAVAAAGRALTEARERLRAARRRAGGCE